MENFAEKLKKALKDKGMTQGELCEKIGMTPNGLKKMIDLGTTRVDTLESICKVLDVPITYFLDIEIPKPAPVGLWKRLVDEATEEAKKWKYRAYELEEQLGVGNFSLRIGLVNNINCGTKFKLYSHKMIA